MNTNFKAIATKTMIASAIASMMVGAAMAADDEETAAITNGSTIITSTETQAAINKITNDVTSNRVSDENASQKDVGALYFNRIGKNDEAAWKLAEDLTFANNSSVGKGGAISLDNSSIELTGAVFTNNTAAGQGGAIRMWADSQSESSVTLNYTKDVLLAGNKAGVGNDTTLPSDLMPGMGINDQGGFAYLNGAKNTLTINAGEGATVTIGNAGAASVDGLDSIASNAGAVVNFNGPGTINMNGSMESFAGTINVEAGTTLNMATGFGSFDIGAQYAANDLNKDSADAGSVKTVANALNIGNGATVNMNDVLDITADTTVTVNDDAVFNVDGINVVPTTYTDKAGEADARYEKEVATTSTGSFTINGTTNVKHDVVVNGTGSTVTTTGTGYLDIAGSLSVLNGSANIGTDTDAARVVLGNKIDDETSTKGELTITSGTFSSDSFTFGTDDSKVTVNGGGLETQSSAVFEETHDAVSVDKHFTFTEGELYLTDEGTFTADDFKAYTTALNNNSVSLEYVNADLVSADGNASIDDLILVGNANHGVIDTKPLGAGHTVTNDGVTTIDDATLTTAFAGKNDTYTFGALNFVKADAVADYAFSKLTLGNAENTGAKFVIRGTRDGQMFLNADDAEIVLNNVSFGADEEDRGATSNKVTLGTDTTVNAGAFAFGEVNTNGKTFFTNEGAQLTVSSVTEKATGYLNANGGKVTYLGTLDDSNTLTVNGGVQIWNGGTYIAGNHDYAGLKDTNTLYIGQKTVFSNSVEFGGGASDNSANAIVLDMASIAQSGFSVEDTVLSITSVKIDNVTKSSSTIDLHLINLDPSITTKTTDDETGKNYFTLNVGKVNGLSTELVLEGNDSVWGDLYGGTYSNQDGTATIHADEAYDTLRSNEDSYVAQQAASVINNMGSAPNKLIASVLNITEQQMADRYGVPLADFQTNVQNVRDDAQSDILDAAEDVTLGAIESGAFSAAFDYNNEVWKALDRRMTIANLNAPRNPSGITPWVDVFGTANEAKSLFGGSDGNYGYEADIYGAVLGFDWTAPCGAIIGLALNVGSADANSKGDFSTDSDADSDYYGISLYGSHRIGNFNGKVDFGYIHAKNDITTKTFFGHFDESLDADIFTFGLGAEYLANVGAFNIVPHAGIRWSRLDMDDSEYGADYDAMNLFQVPMGVTFSGTFDMTGWKVAPMIDISVVPAFGDKDAVANFAGGFDDSVRVVDSNPVQMTLGVNAQVDAWTFGVNYGLTAGSDDRLNNAFNLNARYTF